MDNRAIGIFDSGVGGLSVLLEIQKLLPNESVVFVADQAFVPYGQKTKPELLERVSKIVAFMQQQNVKAVVAACNTATVYTINEMRQRNNLPIIGTVPVIKTLARISKTRKAAVLSTQATAKSQYLADLIQQFAPDMEVKKIGGSNLEELIEQGKSTSPETQAVLNELLPPLAGEGVDAIALGCTHYPFLRGQIQHIVGNTVAIVDSGGAVARRLNQVLLQNNALALTKKPSSYFTTGNKANFQKVAEQLMEQTLEPCQALDL